MNESWEQEGTADLVEQPTGSEALTAGAMMRRAREAAGLHVAALAVSLKVPVRKLEALEQDRWDELPDAVFVRGLASSVCRTLKIDGQPVLDRLPQTAAPRLIKVGEGINKTFRAPSDGAPPGWRQQLSRPVFLVVFALLFGALVLVLLPTLQQSDLMAAVTGSRPAVSTSPAVNAPATVIEPSAATSLPAAPVAQVATDGAAPPSTSEAAPAAVAVSTVTPAPAAAPAPAEAAAAAAPAVDNALATPAGGIIVFHTRNPSWIEVTDAKGVVAVRRLLAAGDSAGASGALPLQVTIGRVDATEVQVRGKPFDLRPVSRDNVARFEVK
jgi:cytoskeleton protein RodZ